MSTYFGSVDSSGALNYTEVGSDPLAITIANGSSIDFNCPGSGAQTLDSLEVYIKNAGSSFNCRLPAMVSPVPTTD